MRALWIASLMPREFNWLAGPWNLRSLVALRDLAGLEVCAVSPMGLTPPEEMVFTSNFQVRKLKQWWSQRWNHAERAEVQGVVITYPRWIWPPKRFFWRYEGRLLYRQIRSHLREVIQEFRPDVIHAPWLHPDAVAACLCGREHGIPVVAQGIGNDANVVLHRCPNRSLVIADLQKASVLLFNCESTREQARLVGLDHPNVRIVYHGVEVDKFRPADTPPRNTVRRIVTVAQLIPRKNHQLLLEAYAQLPAELKDTVELEFIGGGPIREQLEDQARRLGIADKVCFAGQPSHEDMITSLQQADLFCLPTLSEGMPVVTIEAMACGLPVIASRVDGIPESVVHGVSGLLVPPDDVEALKSALQEGLARDWDRQAVRQVVLDKFTWNIYAEQIHDLYESAISMTRGDVARTSTDKNQNRRGQ